MIGSVLYVIGWMIIGYSVGNIPEDAIKEYKRLKSLKNQEINPTAKEEKIKKPNNSLVVDVDYTVAK